MMGLGFKLPKIKPQPMPRYSIVLDNCGYGHWPRVRLTANLLLCLYVTQQ